MSKKRIVLRKIDGEQEQTPMGVRWAIDTMTMPEMVRLEDGDIVFAYQAELHPDGVWRRKDKGYKRPESDIFG